MLSLKIIMDKSLTPSTSSMAQKSSLPSELYLLKLIESHSLEIQSLNDECQTKAPKLMSQRLPRFMRRRASSHNPKRVPKSVRQSYVDKTTESVTKPGLQKNKNKKKFINKKKREQSLKRRNQKNDRSVLHVWFAKRFHMKMHWNCLLPEKNTTKNQRVLYRNSKNDFVFYNLSHINCLEIDYSKSERQQLISFLSKFIDKEIGPSFGAKIYESDKREANIILFEKTVNLLNIKSMQLVSSYFLWNQTFSKLWLWIHISVYDRVLQMLTDFLQKDYSIQLKFNRRTKQLERFRLIGPNCLQLLSKCLNYDFNSIKSEAVSDNSVHYFRSIDNNITSIDSNQTNLFDDIQESESLPKTNNSYDFILILKNSVYKNRLTVDLVVSSSSAKHLWLRFAENRGHRAGGLRDLKMIAFNTSSLLYPTFGFIDAEENKTKLQKLRILLKLNFEQVHVIRSDSIVSKLSQNLNSLAVNQVLNDLNPLIKQNNVFLINVELVCVDRGVPQEFDPICIPTEEDLQSYYNKTNDKNITEEMEIREKSMETDRKIIGLIEFGEYCLEVSKGKGVGVISITSLKQLIEINEKLKLKNNENYKNNKILAAFLSIKSGLHRIVTIKVIDSVFST